MSPTRHEYRLKSWAQAFYLAWGVCVVGFGIGIASAVAGGLAAVAGGNWGALAGWPAILIILGFLLLGCFFVALALHSLVVLDDMHISVRFAVWEKSADLSEIKGYRITRDRSGSFWRFELKESRRHISIMRAFQVDDRFRAFLSQLKNLDDDQDLASPHPQN